MFVQGGFDNAVVDDLAAFLRRTPSGVRRGFFETALPDVQLFWGEASVARSPLVYEPGIAVFLSGQKTGFLGDRRFVYNASNYLVVGLPVSFECEAVASPEEPIVTLFLKADPAVITDLADTLIKVAPGRFADDTSLGVEPMPVTPRMHEAVARLCRHLMNDADAKLLGPQTVREIFYLALQDSHGRVLLAQARSSRPASRIARLLGRSDIEGTESVEFLAQETGLSVPSFHRHFKASTGLPPKKYFQRRRLFRAKSLLVFDG